MRRVLLVEPHQTLRQALACVLEKEQNLEMVAQAGSLAEYRSIALERIDVAVIDPQLPDANGIEPIHEVSSYDIPVIVLTLTPSSSVRSQALEAGANEVLGKDASFEELLEAIRRAVRSGRAPSPSSSSTEESTSDGF